MGILDSLPDRWSGMQREWEMVAEMIDAIVIPTPDPPIPAGFEYIGATRLLERSDTITLTGLSCGLASAGAAYQALHVLIILDGGSGQTDRPHMYANEDTTETNYYGVNGNNIARVFTDAIAAGTGSIVLAGFMYRDNSMAGSINNYFFEMHSHINTYAGSFQAGADRGWKWLNPNPDDVLTSLTVFTSLQNFEIGSQIRVWGLRPGI